MIFCEKNREKLKKKHPEVSAKDIVYMLSSLWKEIKNTPNADIYKQEKKSKNK